jgi:hypothetical protein
MEQFRGTSLGADADFARFPLCLKILGLLRIDLERFSFVAQLLDLINAVAIGDGPADGVVADKLQLMCHGYVHLNSFPAKSSKPTAADTLESTRRKAFRATPAGGVLFSC